VQGLKPWSSSAAPKQKNAYYDHDNNNERRMPDRAADPWQQLAHASSSSLDLEQLVKVTIHYRVSRTEPYLKRLYFIDAVKQVTYFQSAGNSILLMQS
jgi:hypothetical protein